MLLFPSLLSALKKPSKFGDRGEKRPQIIGFTKS